MSNKKIRILEKWQIYDNPVQIQIKGNAKIRFKKEGEYINEIHLKDIPGGISIIGSDIDKIEAIEIYDENIITIENLTSFYQFNKKNFFCFYLGGYSNRIQEKFIAKFFDDNKNLWHFGDIDKGGMWIYINLCKNTGKNFKPLHMGKEDLETYFAFTQPLSNEEIVGLNNIKEQTKIFNSVIEYMTNNKVKLEQEIITVI